MSWKKVGSLRKSDKGDFYIKIDDTVTLEKGQSIQVQDPRKRIKTAVEAGKLSKEVGEEMLGKIKEYIRYELVIPPKR